MVHGNARPASALYEPISFRMRRNAWHIKLLVWLGGLLLVAVLVTFCGSAFVIERAIHRVVRHTASQTATQAHLVGSTVGVNATKVCIRAQDGAVLTAWWFSPKQPNGRAVMVCHGVGDSAYGSMRYALLFLRHRYAVLVPNGRGHGDSQGYVTYGVLEAKDTVRWVDWMKSHDVTSAFGLGESLGGSILIDSLGDGADFRAVVAECPYSSFEAIADERVGRLIPKPAAILLVKEGLFYTRLRYGVDATLTRPDVAIRKTRVPVLLIHGTADNQTIPANSERIVRANPRAATLWLVRGAGHTGAYATVPKEFERRVLAWFAQRQDYFLPDQRLSAKPGMTRSDDVMR